MLKTIFALSAGAAGGGVVGAVLGGLVLGWILKDKPGKYMITGGIVAGGVLGATIGGIGGALHGYSESHQQTQNSPAPTQITSQPITPAHQ